MSAVTSVLLTLNNVPLPRSQLENTPSMQDKLAVDIETDCRIVACEMIHDIGKVLGLNQICVSTAQLLLQRYYYRKSLLRFDFKYTAMACLFLASKIEESPKRLRDLIAAFRNLIFEKAGMANVMLDSFTDSYFEIRNHIIKSERRVLKELGFCVHMEHPHKLIVNYLKILELADNVTVVQRAWNFMNDSFLTNVFCIYKPEVIATATIYLTVRELKCPLPKLPWWELFEVTLEEVEATCRIILSLYVRNITPFMELEDKIEKLFIGERAPTARAVIEEGNKKGECSGASLVASSAIDSGQGMASAVASAKKAAQEAAERLRNRIEGNATAPQKYEKKIRERYDDEDERGTTSRPERGTRRRDSPHRRFRDERRRSRSRERDYGRYERRAYADDFRERDGRNRNRSSERRGRRSPSRERHDTKRYRKSEYNDYSDRRHCRDYRKGEGERSRSEYRRR
eukprot:Nk52_evm30s288 gene=Nk52_evmTU30s288